LKENVAEFVNIEGEQQQVEAMTGIFAGLQMELSKLASQNREAFEAPALTTNGSGKPGHARLAREHDARAYGLNGSHLNATIGQTQTETLTGSDPLDDHCRRRLRERASQLGKPVPDGLPADVIVVLFNAGEPLPQTRIEGRVWGPNRRISDVTFRSTMTGARKILRQLYPRPNNRKKGCSKEKAQQWNPIPLARGYKPHRWDLDAAVRIALSKD
jgi:hypothetical protein